MNLKKLTPICGIVAAVLALAIIVLQFFPFWTYQASYGENAGKDTSVSIAGYVWLPSGHAALLKEFKALNEFEADYPFETNDIAFPAAAQLAFSVLTCIFCAIKRNSSLSGVFPVVAGCVGAYMYLSMPQMQLNGIWVVSLILSILVFLAGLVMLVSALKRESEF